MKDDWELIVSAPLKSGTYQEQSEGIDSKDR